MVQIEKQIEKIAGWLKYYDKNGILPFEKVKIDITLSMEALEKLRGKNKSKVIEELVMKKL